MNIKRNIIFSLENRKKNGIPIVENVPIRMRLIFNGNRVDFSTGYRIDFSKWDNEKQRVKNGCSNKLKQSASEINTQLLKYYSDIQSIFKEFEFNNLTPNISKIKSAFAEKNKFQNEEIINNIPPLFICFDKFLTESGRQNNWTESTFKKFHAVRNHLTLFNQHLSFDFFNETGLVDYVIFLQKEKGMRNSTVGKQLGYLKWFLRWGLKKGIHNNNTFLTFRPKLKSTQKKVIFLTLNELNLLKDFVIPKNKYYLEKIKDVFLFCCFTGLRYSDAHNLKRSDIKENYIEITTVKTSDSLIIELNNFSRTILKKYENILFEHDKALPIVTNQKMNDYLKELAKLAGLNEPVRETYYAGNKRIDEVKPKYELISTHVGRRTFICNALSLGILPQVVMKWTGHSDYKAMKPYIDIADDIKANAMQKFNLL